MTHPRPAPAKDASRPLSVRNLPAPVARAVRARAAADGISLNRAVIRILEEGLGLRKPVRAPIGRSLDWFIGSLSAEDADEMLRFIASERRIDPDDWR